MRGARLQKDLEVRIDSVKPISYGQPLKLLGYTAGARRPWKVCVFDVTPRIEEVSVSGEAAVGANLVVIRKEQRCNGEFVCRAVPATELDEQADHLEDVILSTLLGSALE